MAFPATYNFNYYQGDTYSFTILPKNSDGTPFDLEDYTAQFVISTERGSGGTRYTGSATVDSVTAIVTCTIPHLTGRNFDSTVTHVYDVQITKDAEVYTLLTGTITVQREITGAV